MSPTRLLPLAPAVLVFALAALAGTAAADPRATLPIDRIQVVVNDEVITAGEVAARVAAVRRRLAGQNVTLPPDEVLARQVVERMVIERLQLQLARQLGLSVSEERLDRALEQIAGQNGKTTAELAREVAGEPGGMRAFREELRTQLLVQQLVEREVGARVAVSDAEVEGFLARQATRADAEYDLSHILIALPEKASPEAIAEARARAEDLHRQLKNGADFGQLAVAHSQGQNALDGGRLGWRAAGQLPDLFVEALRELAPGQVSTVLRGPNGFHLLRLNDRRGGTMAVNVTQTRARHILVKTGELTTVAEATRRIADLRERIVHGGDFATLARAHSEDIGSAAAGGELGWLSPGQTVPEFERAMNALAPGELSAPVKTPFGVHLIEVLERRERDIGHEREIAEARRQIHARKADERYEQWLRQLRDEAYVDYRPGSGR